MYCARKPSKYMRSRTAIIALLVLAAVVHAQLVSKKDDQVAIERAELAAMRHEEKVTGLVSGLRHRSTPISDTSAFATRRSKMIL